MSGGRRLWGGRFGAGPAEAFDRLNASLEVDRRMWRQDVAGSRAHARMLAACGILPVTDYAQVHRFAGRCGASVPKWLARLFEGLDDDPDTRRLIGAAVAAQQCRTLAREGVRDFHFYTLNRADLAYATCRILGLRHHG